MKRRNGFTLVEVLTVVVITLTVITVTGRLFSDGWTASHRAIAHAENRQLIGLVVKRWQQTLRDTPPERWQVEGRTFRAGDCWVQRDGDDLIFGDARGTRSVFLPDSIGCAFSIERNDDVADCAVMTLAVPYRVLRRVSTNNVRIVACGTVKSSMKR